VAYNKETIRIRNGYLISTDGVRFTAVSERFWYIGATFDISDNITQGRPIYIRKAATRKHPPSKVQKIIPLADIVVSP
jgi:hypothetical protein